MEFVDLLSTLGVASYPRAAREYVDVRRETPEPWASAMIDQDLVDRGSPSLSALARASGVSVETVRRMVYGMGESGPTSVEAVAAALHVNVRKVTEWVGQSRSVASAYVPPVEANLLSARQRKAVDELIRSIAAGQRKAQRDEDAGTTESSTPSSGAGGVRKPDGTPMTRDEIGQEWLRVVGDKMIPEEQREQRVRELMTALSEVGGTDVTERHGKAETN